MSPDPEPLADDSAEPPKDYGDAMRRAGAGALDEVVAYLSQELPYLWRDAYLEDTPRMTNIMRVSLGTFEYIFDDYQTLEGSGVIPYHPTAESRLIAVHGVSAPSARRRDDRRLRKCGADGDGVWRRMG